MHSERDDGLSYLYDPPALPFSFYESHNAIPAGSINLVAVASDDLSDGLMGQSQLEVFSILVSNVEMTVEVPDCKVRGRDGQHCRYSSYVWQL